MTKNQNIEYQILAKHFEKNFNNFRSAKESFRIMKKKYLDKKSNLWLVYVKAYNYDNKILKG